MKQSGKGDVSRETLSKKACNLSWSKNGVRGFVKNVVYKTEIKMFHVKHFDGIMEKRVL